MRFWSTKWSMFCEKHQSDFGIEFNEMSSQNDWKCSWHRHDSKLHATKLLSRFLCAYVNVKNFIIAQCATSHLPDHFHNIFSDHSECFHTEFECNSVATTFLKRCSNPIHFDPDTFICITLFIEYRFDRLFHSLKVTRNYLETSRNFRTEMQQLSWDSI